MRFIEVTIGAAALLGLARAAPAQEAAPTPVDQVVVVANRTPEPLVKVGNSVTVVDDTAIQASQATQIVDLLDRTPGVVMSRNGGEGQPTSIFIRGAESSQTLVLIDGVVINDPAQPAGGFDFGNLLVGDISRIEILRGAQSTLWGSQAIGGVVDVMTAQPATTLEGIVDVQGGSRSTGDFRAAAGGTLGRLSFRLGGGYYTTGGIDAFDSTLGGKVPDPFHNSGFSGRVGYQFTSDIQLDLHGYYTDSRARFDGYDTPTGAFGDDLEYGTTRQYTGYAALNIGAPGARFQNRLDVQYTDTDRRSYDPGVASFAPSIETFYGFGANTRFEYQGTFAIGPAYKLVFGAQHERSTLTTDTPAYDLTPAPLEAHANLDSGYAQLQGEVAKDLSLTGGLRYDDHSTFGGHFTGQASAAWSLNGGTTVLRASFGQGFKAPALYELFSAYGNQSLRPETANSWDAGIEQHFWGGRATVWATYFGRDTRNLIEFINFCPNPAEPFGCYANVEHATAEGVELAARVDLTAALSVSANYTYTDAEDATDHARLLLRPRNTANAEVNYIWPARLTTTVAIRYIGSNPDEGFDANFNTVPLTLHPYTVVDLRASYPVTKRLEIYGRVENLFDEHYETAYPYGSPGRGVFAGLRARF